MSTYKLPPAKPDVSLPPVSRTPQPRTPQVVDESVLDDTPRKALADQISDNERQARMKSKLAEVKAKFGWTTDKAWNYLANVLMDKDFQVEVEQSPEPVGASLAQQQETIRAHVQAAMSEQLADLRRAHPTLPVADLMGLLPADLVQAARRIESEKWMPKPEPVYRFPDTGKSSVTTPALKKILEGIGWQRVEADEPADEKPADDTKPILVYGAAHRIW